MLSIASDFLSLNATNFSKKTFKENSNRTENRWIPWIQRIWQNRSCMNWGQFQDSACYLWLSNWEVRSFVTQEFTRSNSIDCWCFCRWISFRENSSSWFTQTAISENSTAPLMFALLVSQFVLNLLYDSTKNIAPTYTHLSNLYLAVVVIDSNDTGSANSTTRNKLTI